MTWSRSSWGSRFNEMQCIWVGGKGETALDRRGDVKGRWQQPKGKGQVDWMTPRYLAIRHAK